MSQLRPPVVLEHTSRLKAKSVHCCVGERELRYGRAKHGDDDGQARRLTILIFAFEGEFEDETSHAEWSFPVQEFDCIKTLKSVGLKRKCRPRRWRMSQAEEKSNVGRRGDVVRSSVRFVDFLVGQFKAKRGETGQRRLLLTPFC